MIKEKISTPDETPRYIIFYESLTGGIEMILGLGIFIFGKRIFVFYARLRNEGFLDHSHNVFVMFIRGLGLLPFFVRYRTAIAIFLILLGSVKIVSAVGLWSRKKWATYLLMSSLGLLVPFDIAGIIRNPTAIKLLYLIVNLAIIFYLLPFRLRKHNGRFDVVKKHLLK